RVGGVEIATVVGPPGQAIATDRLGRVKVRFHWDRRAPADDTCWARVAREWTGGEGGGHGVLFTPRIGTEVVVAFVGGDVDRPIVVGCLDNPHRLPIADLPGHDTVSGLVTRSTPGADGHNALLFDDAAGRERVAVRAQRDLEL